jgi:uncharacterized protein YcgI (DUF1989 family)
MWATTRDGQHLPALAVEIWRRRAAGWRSPAVSDYRGDHGLRRGEPRASEKGPMATPQTHTIPARRGAAARVAAGQRIKVINTHGTQVVDTWAFNGRDVAEWMSMEASRAWFLKLRAAVGDAFLTNQRRPILTLVEDTSGGAHDTLMAACDLPRYRLLGVQGHHDNCRDNLHAALAGLGITVPGRLSPLNRSAEHS